MDLLPELPRLLAVASSRLAEHAGGSSCPRCDWLALKANPRTVADVHRVRSGAGEDTAHLHTAEEQAAEASRQVLNALTPKGLAQAQRDRDLRDSRAASNFIDRIEANGQRRAQGLDPLPAPSEATPESFDEVVEHLTRALGSGGPDDVLGPLAPVLAHWSDTPVGRRDAAVEARAEARAAHVEATDEAEKHRLRDDVQKHAQARDEAEAEVPDWWASVTTAVDRHQADLAVIESQRPAPTPTAPIYERQAPSWR